MPDVLLVDPDAKARAIAAWGLARDGFDVVAAASGDEALRRAEDSPPRLVLADLDLGDVDGIGLLTELRRRESTRSVPFFFVASGDVAALRERGYRAGAQDVFARPLFVRDLCTLARLHGGRPAQETAASGDLADVRLHFLLRLLVSGGRTGRLRLSPSDAAFAFRSGRIVDAAYGRLRGEAAVLRAAILAEGPFRVEYVAVEERDPMAFTTRDVVHRLFPRVRRWDELRAALPPLWSVLETDFKSLGGQVEAMPPPVRALTRLFDGRRDLRTVVLESDLDDLVAIEVVARLDALGILRRPQGLAPALPRRGQTSSASTGPPDSSRRSSPGLAGDDAVAEGLRRLEGLFATQVHALRILVEMMVEKGLISRDDYLARVKTGNRGPGSGAGAG